LPRQLGKTQTFPEMSRQLRKFLIFSYEFKNTPILGHLKDKTTLKLNKAKLTLPNLMLQPEILSFSYSLSGVLPPDPQGLVVFNRKV